MSHYKIISRSQYRVHSCGHSCEDVVIVGKIMKKIIDAEEEYSGIWCVALRKVVIDWIRNGFLGMGNRNITVTVSYFVEYFAYEQSIQNYMHMIDHLISLEWHISRFFQKTAGKRLFPWISKNDKECFLILHFSLICQYLPLKCNFFFTFLANLTFFDFWNLTKSTVQSG